MPISDTSIYFIIALLGLAYPVSLTVITRLDEKYKSVTILQLFKACWQFVWFQRLLITTIIIVAIQVIWTINWKPLPNEHPTFVYHDWAEISLSTITAALLVVFFFFIHLIFEFYIPLSLVSWLRKQPDDDDRLIFRALTAMMFFGIEIKDADLVATLRAHFGQLFIDERANTKDNEPVRYPVEYYEMVYDTIFRSSQTDYWKVKNIGFTAASGRWLIGSREHFIIDELTYAWLWNNLKLMLKVDREDFVEEFWHNSHYFITSALAPIPWQHDDENPRLILNKAAVDQREKERDQFFEFHMALGAMLLYEKRYGLLKRLFNHTTSIPVRYELLPLTMNAVLGLFFRFWTNDGLFYIGRYQFPDQNGIQGEFVSREFTARFTALLFIRQYFLVSQWYGYEPVSQPQPPTKQEERSTWIQQLPYFKKFLEDIQNDKELLHALGYEPITADWADQHQKATPGVIIDQLLRDLKAVYAATEVEQRAEEDKKRAFREKSAQIIDGRVASYNNVLNGQAINDNFDASNLKGGYILYQKAAFAIDQGVSYLNYDTFFAGEIASNFTRQITQLFRSKAAKHYLFRAPEFFEAIDRLKLKPTQHVLVNFGVSIDETIRRFGIDRLTAESYKGIPIINVQFVDHTAMRSSMIAMKRSDLPSFFFRPPQQAEIDCFELIEASQATQLYAAVVDLNEHDQLKALFPNEPREALDTSVILVLELNIEVRWKKKSKLIRLSMYSEFYQQGSVNDIIEVKPF